VDKTSLTHAELAAMLVAEGCLPMAQGKQPAKMPVEALPLQNEERERIQARPDGLAVFYPVGETGVFMEFGGNSASVWYEQVDCEGAVATLEQALNRAAPSVRFEKEAPHPDVSGMNVRFYRLETDSKRFVKIEVVHPVSREARQRFVVNLHALERI
jgi:hypothetical protein